MSATTFLSKLTRTLIAGTLALTTLLVVGASPAVAAGENSVTMAVTKVGKNSITVKPAIGAQGHYGLWEMEIKVSSNAKIETRDGKNTLKSIKRGMVVEAAFTSAVKTSMVMVPVITRVGNSTYTYLIPIVQTSIEGDMISLREVPGRCTSKNIKLGGRGEKVGVGICRTGGNFEIVANFNDAEHADDVKKAFQSATLSFTDKKSGAVTKTGFTVTDGYATATVTGAPSYTVSVAVTINADGPHDGRGAKDFVVTRSTRL